VVKVLCYKSEGRWFDPRWCHVIFHWHKSFWSHYSPRVDSAFTRNGYQEYFLGGKCSWCVRLTTLPPSCAVVKKSGNPNFLGPSGPLQACNRTALLCRCTNFSNLFWIETLHLFDSSSVHHQVFFTVHTEMLYVTQVCRQLSSRIRMELDQFLPDPARKLSTNLYDIPFLCVQWKTPDDGQRNCLKHVEFHSTVNLGN
jgi:hypothetical protein